MPCAARPASRPGLVGGLVKNLVAGLKLSVELGLLAALLLDAGVVLLGFRNQRITRGLPGGNLLEVVFDRRRVAGADAGIPLIYQLAGGRDARALGLGRS